MSFKKEKNFISILILVSLVLLSNIFNKQVLKLELMSFLKKTHGL